MQQSERSKAKSIKISPSDHHQRRTTLDDLPPNVVDEILVRLHIRYAVRTTLISRAWRHRWRSIPSLVFFSLDFVSRALLRHTGPIRTFEVLMPKASPSPPIMDDWLVNLSSRTARSLCYLTLAFTGHLHSSAFSFSNLIEIHLFQCHFNPPHDFPAFKHLTKLQLQVVTCLDAARLSALISASPVLEDLYLMEVTGRGCLKIQGPKIFTLIYDDSRFDDFALGSCPVLAYAEIMLYRNDSGQHHYDSKHDGDDEQWLHLGDSSEVLVANGIPEIIAHQF